MTSNLRHSDLHTKQVSKHFRQQLKAKHATFLASIQGLSCESEREQYAALMLNRLMATYFLQGKGLLDDDRQYLSNRLRLVQEQQGQERFYHDFLLPLFHEYLGKPALPTCANACIGKVPALHLRLFSKHALESASKHIQIADKAFLQIFAFFNKYRWSLDTPLWAKNELPPDVLTYIFAQQINQKQMGAYYTEDDITAYIARNTIIPYLFDRVKAICPAALEPQAAIWQLLRTTPDRYIHQVQQRRQHLPGETEREYKLQRLRYMRLYTMLQAGMICTVSDFITHNLNIMQFALDMITTCEQPALLLAFYTNLEHLTVLDPTCGLGAFLLAALTVLKALYVACLERMHTLSDEAYSPLLRRVALHPHRDHFILTHILTYNLHGVDVMEEATNMCKLRLFLALLAQIAEREHARPLAALDRNIRTGNALVGLLRHSANDMHALEPWQASHQPFHWFCEFEAIMQRGGFDVIIGNPPYIEYSKVRQAYRVPGYETASCGNLYAAVIERSLALCRANQSYLGFLVPLSICGSGRFAQLRHIITHNTSARWLANFAIFPSRLLDAAFQRLSILIAKHDTMAGDATLVTRIQRWYAAERIHLIDMIEYTQCSIKAHVYPKLASPLQETILQKVQGKAQGNCIAMTLQPEPGAFFVYYQEATNYWTKAVCHIPFYKKNGVVMRPPHSRLLYFSDEQTARAMMALLNSSLFYVWFATFSDGFHLSHALVKDFPIGEDFCQIKELHLLSRRLEEDIQRHTRRSTRHTGRATIHNRRELLIEIEEYQMRYSKALLDEIDHVLAQYYNLTDEELDFIINYDSKYRLGKDNGDI